MKITSATIRTLVAMVVTAMTIGSWSAPAWSEKRRDYILATATMGGTYYPVGVALATTTKVKLAPTHNISLSAISSAGSGENLKLMRDKQAQFAILQGLYGAWAWHGEGPLKANGPQTHLRSVTMLWENVEHFVVDQSLVNKGDISDLERLERVKLSIGKRNSGTEGSGRYILERLGIEPYKQFELSYLAYSTAAQALQNGRIQAMNTPAGVPVSSVTRAFASQGDELSILNFTGAQLEQINSNYRLWSPFVIPANTYPGQTKAVNTISQPNFLAVRDDVSDEDVYQVLKVLYANLPFLHNIHKATKAMDVNKAIAGLPVPLHPGAVRYYQEMGIDVPKQLIKQ